MFTWNDTLAVEVSYFRRMHFRLSEVVGALMALLIKTNEEHLNSRKDE